MSFEHNQEVLRRYRSRAVRGGTMIGTILGVIAAGPYFRDWSNPLTSWALVAAGCGLVGALIGYFFFEIALSSLVRGGDGGTSSSGGGLGGGAGCSGEGGGDGGDGGD